jgi:hypothetical protein
VENAEKPVYEFNCQITEEDYFEYSLCHALSIPEIRRRNTTYSYLYSALFFIVGVVGAYFIEEWSFFIVCTIIAFYLATFIRYRIAKAIRRSIRIIEKTGKLPFETNAIMQFYENELVNKSADNTLVTSYSAIERIIVGKNAMYLYKNAMTAYILPNKAFVNVQPEEFLRWIRTKTNAKLITGVTK